MNRSRRILEAMAISAELPTETLPGIPLVEIAGQSRVLIENHKGVVQYTAEQIAVKVVFGQICVNGCNMKLARMTNTQLVITGRIEGVCLRREKC